MTLVVHWLGGVRLLYTSVQNPQTTSIIVSPPIPLMSVVQSGCGDPGQQEEGVLMVMNHCCFEQRTKIFFLFCKCW